MGAAVVSGVDAPPILEPSEHVLDLVALLVEDGVMGDRDLPIGFRGMQAARHNGFFFRLPSHNSK